MRQRYVPKFGYGDELKFDSSPEKQGWALIATNVITGKNKE